jgi:hypothetical protein
MPQPIIGPEMTLPGYWLSPMSFSLQGRHSTEGGSAVPSCIPVSEARFPLGREDVNMSVAS